MNKGQAELCKRDGQKLSCAAIAVPCVIALALAFCGDYISKELAIGGVLASGFLAALLASEAGKKNAEAERILRNTR